MIEKNQTEARRLAIEIALREKGTKEVDGRGNNPRIIEYGNAVNLKYTKDSIPWCAVFCNWVLREMNLKYKCGIKRTKSAMARSFLKWGVKTDDPQRGDIVVFWRGNPKGSKGHVGFVWKINTFTVSVLGGNQSDEVSIKKYSKLRVLGYRTWPLL